MDKFQVFISCKSQDNPLAEKVDSCLRAIGLNVFFSHVKLEEEGVSEFKPRIDKALEEANVMVVVGTSRVNLEAKWVSYEWSTTFQSDILSGNKPGGEIFVYLRDMEIKDLPTGLRGCQVFQDSPQELIRLRNFVTNALKSGEKTIKEGEGVKTQPPIGKDEMIPLEISQTPERNKSILGGWKWVITGAIILVGMVVILLGLSIRFGNLINSYPIKLTQTSSFPVAILTSTILSSLKETQTPTPEVRVPIINEWCIFPSIQPPMLFTNCPTQIKITQGAKLTIRWNVINAQKVHLSPLGDRNLTGSEEYSPLDTTEFTLSATNDGKTQKETIQVIVVSQTDTQTLLPFEKRIAFTSHQEGNEQIYVMNADGSDQQNLTNTLFDESNPNWSPDGKYIAFTSNRDGNMEIYLMNSDGSGQRNLTNNLGADSSPTWSPDGKFIAFRSDRKGGAGIYVMNADGSNPKKILIDLLTYSGLPSWSPDGKQIAYYSHILLSKIYQVMIMNTAGHGQRILTDNLGPISSLTWLPDGKNIAFSTLGDNYHFGIYVMNADGSNLRNITNVSDSETNPSWSSDGRSVVYSSNTNNNFYIYKMNSDGSDRIKLTDNTEFYETLSWAP